MIAKGKNQLSAEIDFMYETYTNLITRIKKTYQDDIRNIRKDILSIESDASIDAIEKQTLLSPYYSLEDKIFEESLNLTIGLFVSIFSFWEKSLLLCCKFFNKPITDTSKIDKYLNALLEPEEIERLPKLLVKRLDELRNYSTHGSLPSQRQIILKHIVEKEDIGLIEINGEFFFSSFNDLQRILDIIYKTLTKIKDLQVENQNT